MAVFAALDVEVTVNSVNLSDHVTSCSFNPTGADIQTTSFGDLNVTRIGGLQDGDISIEFQSDFAVSETYASLVGLINTLTTVTVKPTSDATSVSRSGSLTANRSQRNRTPAPCSRSSAPTSCRRVSPRFKR